MLPVFWNSEGVVYREFLPKDCTINSECYIQTLKTTTTIKTCFISSPHYFLQHDDTQPHTCATTIVAIKWLCFHVILHVILHFPCSPDLVPSDYYLFHHLKKPLKGQCYLSDDKLKAAVTFFYCISIRSLLL